ncbi:hypothetical protein JCM19046_1460 [Bacillus sp. JCM 19046]|nr:hypothetical protein JCM19045_2563 [Bacillus sp. JCM 19045]GAF16989.1 hypothetical protein JCM19046_1460 [Bacillus sp. JCM 19046]
MTAEIIFASNKLGTVHPNQVQSMLDYHDYGRLVAFEKTRNGAMRQTLFIRSSQGEYVLKGNPLYPGQLQEEQYFINRLQQQTTVPLPTPYHINKNHSLFGWSYALMPRLTGNHLNDETLQTKESLAVADAIARTLLQFHKWTEPTFGQLNPADQTISPFQHSYTNWLFQRILYWLNDASRFSTIATEDLRWTEENLEDSKQAFTDLTSSTFVMGDFKPGNFLINEGPEGWCVSAVFDFTNAYFADPVSDVSKMLLYYMNEKQMAVAERLLHTYFAKALHASMQKRLTVHLIHQLVLDWGNAKATGTVTWDNELPFHQWANQYVEQLKQLCACISALDKKN